MTKWVFFPDWRFANPYQKLLYDALPAGHQAVPGHLAQAKESLDAGHDTIFHLHWEHALYSQKDADQAHRACEKFLNGLAHLKQRGLRVVWTIHNERPHELAYPKLHYALQRHLIKFADVVHFHAVAGITIFQGRFNRELAEKIRKKAVIGYHGHYTNAYPNDITRFDARRFFEIDDSTIVFAYTGPIRAYKGVEDLSIAFEELSKEHENVCLIVAGAGTLPEHLRTAKARSQRLYRIKNSFVDETFFQYVFNAADVAAYPYKRVMTSGSVQLAHTFYTPVIVPDYDTLREYTDISFDFRYHANDPVALNREMEKFVLEKHKYPGVTSNSKSIINLNENIWKNCLTNIISSL